MVDTIHIEGHIIASILPDNWTQAEVDYWWNPQTVLDSRGRRIVIGPSRMSRREKERYIVNSTKNIITNQGRNQIVTYIGTNGAYTSQFGNILSLGNGSIANVNGSDTTIPGEYYRQAPTTQIYTGSTQVDMQTTITSNSAAGTVTSIGIWGNGATTTLGTGSLLTHALFSLTIPVSSTTIIDYLIILS